MCHYRKSLTPFLDAQSRIDDLLENHFSALNVFILL